MEVLEQAGSVFYYSTKTGGQQVPLHHGVAISGALDVASITAFCREHDIGLLIDAAHPFAVQLHNAVAEVAQVTGIPAVRYERIFPERDSDIIWLDSYAEAIDRIGEKTLLAATGVQSIAKLKPLEERGVKIYYRILPREDSIAMAKAQGADQDQLLYYTENELSIFNLSAPKLGEVPVRGMGCVILQSSNSNLLSPSKNHGSNNRGTYKRGDGVDRQCAFKARHTGNKVA